MSLLVETLRIENGNIRNPGFHNERMSRSLYGIYGIRKIADIRSMIDIPDHAMKGIFKCRLLYDNNSFSAEYLPYSFRSPASLKIVFEDNICYPYKYVNRSRIDALYDKRSDCDDIIIIKSGLVTDSSCSNLIFRDSDGAWHTPSSFLLAGTKRASLLQSGLICETRIKYMDIGKYSEVRLINAMLDIDDTESIPVDRIRS